MNMPVSNMVKSAVRSLVGHLIPSNERHLEFSDTFVTDCVKNNQPIFVWDGTKGPISDYSLKEVAGEWKLKIVARRDNPKHGIVVAVPTGRRTVAIFKRAKVQEMVELGYGEVFAKLYLARSRGVRHNHESEVVEWVRKNYLMPQADFEKLVTARLPKPLAKDMGYDVSGVSQVRFQSCLTILENFRHDDAAMMFAVENVDKDWTGVYITYENKDEIIDERNIVSDLESRQLQQAVMLMQSYKI